MLKLKSLIAKIRDGVRAVFSAVVKIARVAIAAPVRAVFSSVRPRMWQCAAVALALVVSAIPIMPVGAVVDNNQVANCVNLENVLSGNTFTFGGSRVEGPATVLLNQCGRSVNVEYCLGSSNCIPNNNNFLASGELQLVNRSTSSGQWRACYHPFRPIATTGSRWNCDDGRSASVNECSSGNGGCSSNATCRDTDTSRTGGVTCQCNSGYTGNGVSCTRVSSPPPSTGGPNSCEHANDGECDDRNYSIRQSTACTPGTDENDCRAANSGGGGTPTPPPSSGGGGGGEDDGGSDNTWIYIAGGVVVVGLIWLATSGSAFAPDITPIVEHSPDGAIYGARIESAAPEQSGAMWWEYREFHGNHLHNHSVEFGGDWGESGLFAGAEISEGDAGIDWRVKGGKEWQSGQWALRSGADAAGLGQFGQGPEVDLQMAVEYAVDGWRATSGFNVSAEKPSDAAVEVRTEWTF